jgi:anti-sigma factor RsiW
MNCQEAKNLIDAYGDGELDAPHSLAVESHMRECANCSSLQRQRQALKSTLAGEGLHFKLPPGLRRQVVTELRRTVRPEPRPSFWALWRSPIGAVAFAAVLLFFLLSLPGRFSSSRQLVEEIISSHARSLQANHLMDVASTDQHTVKPWLDNKLDFAPPVKDLATNGFPLTGGRLDYINGHSAAALVYMRHQHIINLFIWPVTTADSARGATVTIRGYHLIHWTSSGMMFWAVSDLNEKELALFADEFRGN